MEDYSDMGLTTEAGNISMLNMTGQPPPVQRQNNTLQQALSISIGVVVAILMIGVGCGVDVRVMKVHFLKPVGMIVGFVCQYFLMPVIAFALAKIAQMSDIETLGLLLVGSCPGGTFSNIATYWIDGDLGLSVAMTTVSNTLGLGMMPLLLFIYSYAFSSRLVVPFQTIGIALASLIVPILLGMVIRYKRPELAKKLIKFLTGIGSIILLGLVIGAFIYYGNALTITTSQLICAAFFPIIGMLLGYGLSSLTTLVPKLSLTHKQRRTICFETGIQNTQLPGTIIHLSFQFQYVVRLVLFPLAYFVSQVTWVLILLIAYKCYNRRHPSQAVEDENTNNEERKSDSSPKGETNKAFESDLTTHTS